VSAPASGLKLGTGTTGEVTLSDLRDVGLAVMQIRQQSINIFLEATRRQLTVDSPAKMRGPEDISLEKISESEKFLEARPEWLTFYVATLEPIIHLFKEDVKDVESGVEKVIVPKGTKDKFEKLIDDYENSVKQLNVHLDEVFDQINEPNNNMKLAKCAVKMFELTERIEKGRQEAFVLVQQSADNKEKEELRQSAK